MKNVLKMIAFIAYTIIIFFIKDIIILYLISILHIVLMLLCHISIQKATKNIIKLMPFILFTAIINICTVSIKEGVLIGIRLILVCNITYIYAKTTTARKIAKGIEDLLYPLSKIGVNIKNIGIMISIAITFIPIISNEIQKIKYSLIAKGCNMTILNQIKHINYIMGPLFYIILNKVSNIEEALISKGYIGE